MQEKPHAGLLRKPDHSTADWWHLAQAIIIDFGFSDVVQVVDIKTVPGMDVKVKFGELDGLNLGGLLHVLSHHSEHEVCRLG
jgi:hypothetical protein